MAWQQSLRTLYSLNTLDTRLAGDARSPVTTKQAFGDSRSDPARPSPAGGSEQNDEAREKLPEESQSNWNTTEFYVYYAVFVICIPLMLKCVLDISQRKFLRFKD